MPQLTLDTRSWPLKEPFRISRGTEYTAETIVVRLEHAGAVAHGEAAGLNYKGESTASMATQIEAIRDRIEQGLDRTTLQTLLPAGGARNAVDAALWDLEAKTSGIRVWQRAGISTVGTITSAITIGIRDVAGYASSARTLSDHPWIKIKVDRDAPVEAVQAVRREAPLAKLIVDPNQSWTLDELRRHAPRMAELGVSLLEQPIARGQDQGLAHYQCPVPLCADESFDGLDDLPHVVGRYQVVNIKLDKTGGLTAALELARASRAAGLDLMVGCMIGGSVAMAPAIVLAALCDIRDIDGPMLQADDWENGIVYRRGIITPPWPALWG